MVNLEKLESILFTESFIIWNISNVAIHIAYDHYHYIWNNNYNHPVLIPRSIPAFMFL